MLAWHESPTETAAGTNHDAGSRQSIIKPIPIADNTTEPTYIAVALLPNVRPKMRMEAKLAAGPAISITNAIPGDKPLSISDKAIGIDPVAQTYIGTATSTTASIAKTG